MNLAAVERESMLSWNSRIAIVALTIAASACAPQGYIVTSPSPSGLKSETAIAPAAELFLADRRQDTAFSTGRLKADLSTDAGPIEPADFLATHLQKEFESRGVPVRVTKSDKGPPRLVVTTFNIINHRQSGFSPFVTFTYLAADLETSSGTKPIGVFIKRGKVPVMSFSEVVEPTFSQPLSLAVKELATKVADRLYGWHAPDRTVDQLIAKVSKSTGGDRFLDVYALGFTNNPRAVNALIPLVRDSDEYVRLAAISSLGTLHAVSQYDLLKSIYETRDGLWQDRAMALKAIGDLDTEESRAFLEEERQYWEGQKRSNERLWTLRVIQLYLGGEAPTNKKAKKTKKT